MSNYRHRCDKGGSLDYSKVGTSIGKSAITCLECGRVWVLSPKGWIPDPCPQCGREPGECRGHRSKNFESDSRPARTIGSGGSARR